MLVEANGIRQSSLGVLRPEKGGKQRCNKQIESETNLGSTKIHVIEMGRNRSQQEKAEAIVIGLNTLWLQGKFTLGFNAQTTENAEIPFKKQLKLWKAGKHPNRPASFELRSSPTTYP